MMLFMNRLALQALCCALLLGFAGLSEAQVGPISFTEPEFPLGTPVQNLTITTLNGAQLPAPLSFDFPNLDATITSGPGTQQFVDPPGIEGPSDLPLTIDFGTPVDFAEFGFAVSCPPVVQDALVVDMFDSSGTLVGSQSFDAIDTGFGSAENLATLQGTVFQRLEATWSSCPVPSGSWDTGDGDTEGNGGGRFFLDNLTYDPTPGVPTMGSVGFAALALVLFGCSIWLLRRRQSVA